MWAKEQLSVLHDCGGFAAGNAAALHLVGLAAACDGLRKAVGQAATQPASCRPLRRLIPVALPRLASSLMGHSGLYQGGLTKHRQFPADSTVSFRFALTGGSDFRIRMTLHFAQFGETCAIVNAYGQFVRCVGSLKKCYGFSASETRRQSTAERRTTHQGRARLQMSRNSTARSSPSVYIVGRDDRLNEGRRGHSRWIVAQTRRASA